MRIRTLFWTAFAALVLLILAVGMNPPAAAQGGDITPKTATPRPSPTNNGGNAKWTVNAMTFKSDFPKGFDFALDVTSTGGKIVEAGVVWSHAPRNTRRAPGKIDPSGKITAHWDASGTAAVPQWVSVEYWWTLKDAAGNIFETPHQYDNYADNTRPWKHAESEDVVVYWESSLPDSLGQDTIAAMRKQRAFYYQNWGKLLDYRPRVILYASYQAWEDWYPQVSTPGGGTMTVGTTSSSWGGTVQLFYGAEKELTYGSVLHEVGHLYQEVTAAAGRDWFVEGDATYFELQQQYDYLAKVKGMAADGTLPTLQEPGPTMDNRIGYDVGYAFFVWLAHTYGPDAHRKLWDLLGQGKARVDALQIVTGKDFVSMERDFRAWLGMKNPEPPTPFPTEELLFPPTPTPADFGATSAP